MVDMPDKPESWLMWREALKGEAVVATVVTGAVGVEHCGDGTIPDAAAADQSGLGADAGLGSVTVTIVGPCEHNV